jgi:sterol desaturase/sphingolipid hydroxylase (fatty acid hydroxylase superfamily)
MQLLVIMSTVLLCSILERFLRFRYRELPFFRDYFTTDLFYMICALGLGLSMGRMWLAPATLWFNAHVPLLRIFSLDFPLWMTLPVAVALFDLGEYVAHRLLHRVDALWEIHKIHHSSRSLDWLATFRSHASEQVIRNLLGPVFLLLIGFPLDATLLSTGIYAAFGVFNHSNTKLNLRWIEPFFITPRLHRMHHFADQSSQTNLGTVLTLWDWMFGTLDLRPLESETLGVPDEVETYPQTWGRQFMEPPRRWFGRGPSPSPEAFTKDA